MNEAKTMSELNNINGAFDKGNVYECVKTSSAWFTEGVKYNCNGSHIIDNDGEPCFSSVSTFKLVTQKEENKTMRTPFNLERALAGDKVVNTDGHECNQFSVIKKRDKNVINFYSAYNNCVYQYLESHTNNLLSMAPKMGKGFINVDADGCTSYRNTKLSVDRLANSDRIMCIDLSQFPEGYGL